MSTPENDGIDEALQGVTHVAMTVAARMGEQIARIREQQAREAQARSEQAVREHAERMTAERQAARAALTSVHRPEWWGTATAEDITKAYTTAKAWSEVDPKAAQAEQRILKEVRTRYDVDVPRDGEPAAVAEAIARTERARAQATEERTGARSDRAEAAGILAAADANDRAAETDRPEPISNPDADPDGVSKTAEETARSQGGRASERREDAGQAYDSAERREAMAEGLDHIENRSAVDARVRSDVAQGRPATDAVVNVPGRAPKARKTKRSQNAARRVERSGQSR